MYKTAVNKLPVSIMDCVILKLKFCTTWQRVKFFVQLQIEKLTERKLIENINE